MRSIAVWYARSPNNRVNFLNMDERSKFALSSPRCTIGFRCRGRRNNILAFDDALDAERHASAATRCVPRDRRRGWRRAFGEVRVSSGRLSLLKMSGQVDEAHAGFPGADLDDAISSEAMSSIGKLLAPCKAVKGGPAADYFRPRIGDGVDAGAVKGVAWLCCCFGRST